MKLIKKVLFSILLFIMQMVDEEILIDLTCNKCPDPSGGKVKRIKITLMKTVPGTAPNLKFQIVLTGQDSEGSTIPNSEFEIAEVFSDNDSAVRIVSYDPATKEVEYEFGKPQEDGIANVANIEARVTYRDEEVTVLGEQVAIVAGNPVTVNGGLFPVDIPARALPPVAEGVPAEATSSEIVEDQEPNTKDGEENEGGE